jgi:hypothetical protein
MKRPAYNVGDRVVFTGWGCCRGEVLTVVEVRKRRLVVKDEFGNCFTFPQSKCPIIWRNGLRCQRNTSERKEKDMKYVFEFLLAVVFFLIVAVLSFGTYWLFYSFIFKLFCWVTGLVSFNLIGPGIGAFVVTCVKVNKDDIFENALELAERIVEG